MFSADLLTMISAGVIILCLACGNQSTNRYTTLTQANPLRGHRPWFLCTAGSTARSHKTKTGSKHGANTSNSCGALRGSVRGVVSGKLTSHWRKPRRPGSSVWKWSSGLPWSCRRVLGRARLHRPGRWTWSRPPRCTSTLLTMLTAALAISLSHERRPFGHAHTPLLDGGDWLEETREPKATDDPLLMRWHTFCSWLFWSGSLWSWSRCS